MDMTDLIILKKNGGELNEKQIEFFVSGVTDNSIPDYQISAFLVAVSIKGMTFEETKTLTLYMARSGEMLDLSALGGVTADKHSTGGVGDKTTLIVAPIAAACGVKIAKMSGRGLGHTGGTIDKLESIRGFRAELGREEFLRVVGSVGLGIISQSGAIAPADKKLYALRDVTATVDSLELIASSIMSKKIASGAENIVLDVKCGGGAFMKTLQEAHELAQYMLRIGAGLGRNMRAVISDMDVPLGKYIGNSLEIEEAVSVLQGSGESDLKEVSLTLAALILECAFKENYESCYRKAEEKLTSGEAFEKFKQMVEAQGGDSRFDFGRAKFALDVKAEETGYVCGLKAEELGVVSLKLGAGRHKKDESIDPLAGIILRKKPGERVKKGETVMTLFSCKHELFTDAHIRAAKSFSVLREAPKQKPLILDILR